MAAPSTSYSSLLRRSKLASFNPQIDQVYTTTSANLSRSNFGFKRPLPAATTKTSPFVRLSQIDSPEGRTVFRKATRETKYVKQWGETGVGLRSEANSAIGGRKWDRLELQSRFVERNGPGAVKPVTASNVGATAIPRMPNVFALSEAEFDRFLEDLGERRDEFKAFVVAESNKTNNASQPASVEDFDLYDHAQRNPTELIRLVERFLRLPSSSTSSLTSAPLPQIHPTLALQYASPTPLESSLAPPIRGRILGPVDKSRNSSYNSPTSYPYQNRSSNESIVSLLSTVSTISNPSNSATPTTFFPDATGVRSNAPGRASFRLTSAVVNPILYASRSAIEKSSSLGRKTFSFPAPTAEYQPATLAHMAVDPRPTLVAAESTTPALPGTPAYSGDLPPDLSRSRSSFGGGKPGSLSLTDLWANSSFSTQRSASRALGGKTQPRNLLLDRKNRRSREEQDAYVRRREALLESTQAEGARERSGAGAAAGRGQGKRAQNQGKQAQQSRDMLSRLDDLLGRKK